MPQKMCWILLLRTYLGHLAYNLNNILLNNMVPVIVEVEDLYKTFKVGIQKVDVLNGISLKIYRGDMMVIFGPSGCGKSTLLHSIIGLEPPTKGKVRILGHDIYAYKNEDDRSEIRKKMIGMVYQQPNWIKSLNVIENIGFPMMLSGEDSQKTTEKAMKLLKDIKMEGWADYSPYELSSGQQQKTALCRALITNPEIIIADEPTGNLDYESGKELMNLLVDLNQNNGKTIIMVTHDLEYLRYTKHFVRLINGKLDSRLIRKEERDDILYESEKQKVL